MVVCEFCKIHAIVSSRSSQISRPKLENTPTAAARRTSFPFPDAPFEYVSSATLLQSRKIRIDACDDPKRRSNDKYPSVDVKECRAERRMSHAIIRWTTAKSVCLQS